MLFDAIMFFLLGGTIGSIYILYVVLAPKNKKFVFLSFITLITISLPLIVSRFLGQTEAETEYFLRCMTFGAIISIFAVLLLAYFKVHRRKIKQIINIYEKAIGFSFLDLLLEGYTAYKEEIQAEIDKTEAKRQQILDNLDIAEFIVKIYLSRDAYNKGKPDELEKNRRAYAIFIMSEFLVNFAGRSSARFSFREYDPKTDSMRCTVTTEKRTHTPANIPLNKKNLISHAMKKQKPIFYSNNKEFHFETNGAIKNKKYDDYVTYCIASCNGKPSLSICFDFKDEIKEKIHALVQSGYFEFICGLINFDIGVSP
jgi:hypothetical protein